MPPPPGASPAARRERKEIGGGSGKREKGKNALATFAIAILLLHAIFVHARILHLSDVAVMLRDDGGTTGGIFVGGGGPPPPPPPSENERSSGSILSGDDDDGGAANATRILVVYSGPNDARSHLAGLYERNTDYFLLHGIDCDYRDEHDVTATDTVIVVGHEYYAAYLPRVRLLNDRCRRQSAPSSGRRGGGWGGWGGGVGKGGGDAVLLVARRNVCYDMESARLALYGGVSGLAPIPTYDYFVFVNCGVTGPAVPPPPPPGKRTGRWTSRFVRLLDDTVKMTGLTLNCEREGDEHIMSMMYAVDRIGLDLIMKSGAIHDCLPNDHNDFINSYERKMGRAILDAGYGLRPVVRHRDVMAATKSNARDCHPCRSDIFPDSTVENVAGLAPSCEERDHYRDIWIGSRYAPSR